MRKYVMSGLGLAAAILTLQAALPHRLEEGRSTEVLGKINFYLKWRPRGIAAYGRRNGERYPHVAPARHRLGAGVGRLLMGPGLRGQGEGAAGRVRTAIGDRAAPSS